MFDLVGWSSINDFIYIYIYIILEYLKYTIIMQLIDIGETNEIVKYHI